MALELFHTVSRWYEFRQIVAQLRARGQHKLADLAERGWRAMR